MKKIPTLNLKKEFFSYKYVIGVPFYVVGKTKSATK